MFSGLDAVAWASLHGTHGSAHDVPRHLEALRSREGDVRGNAVNQLSDAVIHQGTRWQVSAHVVPFLVRLIDDPSTADRGTLTALLRDIGVGSRNDGQLPFEPETIIGGAQIATQQQEDLVVERVYHLEEEFTEDWVDIVDACAVKWDADAYWAVAAHVDAYRHWLGDHDPEVASQAGELLAWFAPAEPTIAALLSVDGDDSVRASANLALAHLTVPAATTVVRLTSLLDHHASVVRITAAIALAYRIEQDLPDRALSILIEAKERESLPEFPPGWRQRAQRGFVAVALQRIGLG